MLTEQKVTLLGFLIFIQMDEITTFCQVSNYYQFKLRNSVFFSYKKLHTLTKYALQPSKTRLQIMLCTGIHSILMTH